MERKSFQDTRYWNKQTQDISGRIILSEDDVHQLCDVLRFHEWRYYVLDKPLISDKEYDQLFVKLKEAEKSHPGWITPTSPTQRVGSDISEMGETAKHLSPMLSLDNSYDATDLRTFDEQVKKHLGLAIGDKVNYAIEPKYDGGSVSIVYENDVFVRASTRGNGEAGEVITENIRTLKTVPLKADFSSGGIDVVEVRGEAIIRKDRFEELNEERASENLDPFANPRNAATGGLRMKDPQDTEKRKIDVFVYQIGHVEPDSAARKSTRHSDDILFLSELSFKTPPTGGKIYNGIEEVIEECHKWEEKREEYPYEIDGMVIKVNSIEAQKKCGFTAHHPRWAIAFKFKAKQGITQLLKVEFQVGKIGSITPVAKLDPVHLAGVEISSVSLHNEDFIRSHDIRIGDYVVVERAGDVIPYIVKVVEERRTGEEKSIEFPTDCPVCAHPLQRIDGEAAWRCVNAQCEAQILQRIIHFASKDAMDIDGLGPALLTRFRSNDFLLTIPDIYRLNYEEIISLKDFGKKSVENLQKAIEGSKTQPLKRLLFGLSIHHVGKKVSSILAMKVGHLLDFQDWTEEDYMEIKDLGPVVARNLVAYFSDDSNIEMLVELEELGVNLEQTEEDKPVEIAEDAPLAGKTILFTGSLETMTRNEAKALAEKLGARNLSAVSSNLNILVVGKNAGSKLTKAHTMGTVKILTEEEFNDYFG